MFQLTQHEIELLLMGFFAGAILFSMLAWSVCKHHFNTVLEDRLLQHERDLSDYTLLAHNTRVHEEAQNTMKTQSRLTSVSNDERLNHAYHP